MVLVAAAGAAACSTHTSPGPPAPSFAIDAGFLFGATVAGYQVEGGDDAADWKLWEDVPGDGGGDGGACLEILSCGQADNGPGFAYHYATDVASAAGLGLNALRFSLEWERLEPTQFGRDGGSYDANALAYYHGLLGACADAGITPMVTLTQGTLPNWLHEIQFGSGASSNEWYGGWRGSPGEPPGPDAGVVQAFRKFSGDMAKEFGSQVDLWLTEDLPMSNALQAYVTGGFPPGGIDQLTDLQAAVINLAYANAAAYDAIHLYDTSSAVPGNPPALVGSANLIDLYAPAPGVDLDAGIPAADRLDYVFSWLLPNAFIDGNLDTTFNSVFGGPPPRGGGIAIPGLAGRADFFGLTYRGPVAVNATQVVNAQPTPDGGSPLTLPGAVVDAGLPDASYTAAPESEAIDAQDLQIAIIEAANHYPILPIYITEITLNENAQPDVLRPAYIVQAVQAVQQAMGQDGIQVKGIFYRSLVDAFEWQDGFAPRTGLFRVDFTDPTRPRTPTNGAKAFGQVAKALGVTPAIQAQWAP
jgi:beta-glucosidase